MLKLRGEGSLRGYYKMEIARIAKIRIELKELSGCGKLVPCFWLEVSNVRQSLALKGSVNIESLDLNLSPSFIITALNGDKTIGSLKTNIDSLVSDKNGNRAEKWLKVKTEEFQNFRIKVGVCLTVLETQTREKAKEKPKVPKASGKKGQVQECPYLSLLVTGHGGSTEPLDEIWRSRNLIKENSINLSMQPESLLDAQAENKGEEEIDLNTLNPDILRTLNGNELKRLVRALCVEVKSLENTSRALPELKSTFTTSAERRRNLGQEGKKCLEDVQSKFDQAKKILNDAFSSRTQKKNDLLGKQEQLKELELQRDKLKMELLTWKDQALYTTLTQRSEQHKADLHSKLAQGKLTMGSHGEQTYAETQKFLRETSEIKEKIKSCTAEFEGVKAQNNLMKKKINDLNASLNDGETLQAQLRLSANLLPQQTESRDSLNQQIISVLPFIQSSNLELMENYSKSVQEKSVLLSTLTSTSNSLSHSTTNFQSAQLNLHKSLLDQLSKSSNLTISSDLTSLSIDISKLKHHLSQSKSLILPDLSTASETLLNETEKILLQSEKLDHMMESVDQQESQLESLQSTMGQVKKRQALHVPIKSDPIDVALAEYLNTKSVPIKFTRQDPGNYIFGSTKIHIKLENSKLIVKVRGGFTSIEEFLNIYTPLEISKSDSPKSQRGSVVIGSKVGKSPSLNASFVKN